jgi:hypothetical protein
MDRVVSWIAITMISMTVIGCSDGVVAEAVTADREGRIINNQMMSSMYPNSFSPADPPYLERDFEAGANFICDEIKQKRGKDLCSEADINWR